VIAGQHLCTKDQTELVLKSWGQQLPKKGETLYVSFAKQHYLNLCIVMLTSYKSVYNKPLYLMEFRHVTPGQMPEPPKDIVLPMKVYPTDPHHN
jgi:hypothetical protein